jgi:dTDP-glucose pyrophosphorylase
MKKKFSKAVIMAAGKGVRMLPITKTIPKVLIKINGRPFLHYVIENLKKAGFNELGIIVGYLKEKIEEFIKNNKIDATIIEQKEQLGTGHAAMQAENFVKNEDFVLLGGDNFWSVNDLKQFNKQDDYCYVGGYEVKNPEKYGVLVTKNNKLIKIVEKPTKFVGHLINTGLYKFTPEIFEALNKIKVSPRGEYEITDAVSILSKKGKVKVIKLKDRWLDLGCKEDILKLEKFLK